jgi:hypothetical protein
MKKNILLGLLVIILLVLLVPRFSAAFYLMDDKLRVKGSIYEFMIYGVDIDKKNSSYYQNTNFGLMKTKGTLELLLKAYECQDTLLNLFGFFKWYHESVPDFDGNYRRSLTAENRRLYQEPTYDQDDWINELYADFYKGPWNIRLGKQIVFWSEVELVRTIDQVNQLDLRYTVPGIDPWDEMKLGLWMMRGFYNSQLPGQLVFEVIWVPGDFEGVRTPTEGTFWGSPPGPEGPVGMRPFPYGLNAALEKQWRNSKPAVSLKNSEYALRIKGNSEVFIFKTPYLLDWSLSYFRAMNNTPVVKNRYMDDVNSYNLALANRRQAGDPLPRLPKAKWWEYRFYNLFGTSVQTFVPSLKGVLRGEFMYEYHLPKMTADPKEDAPSYSKAITGKATRDVVNLGVTYDRPIRWPWLQSQQWLGANGILDTSFGWYEQWKLGDVNKIRETFGYQKHSSTNFSFMTRTSFNNNAFTFVYRMLWNTEKWGYASTTLSYTPGAHFRYEVGYMFFQAHDPWSSREAQTRHNDNIYTKIGYEF